jgi:hypothetical protein
LHFTRCRFRFRCRRRRRRRAAAVLVFTCRPVGGPALRSLIDTHFDDNVVLKNPLFSSKGKEQL